MPYTALEADHMPTHSQLVGRITVGLLVMAVAAGCGRISPQLRSGVDK